MVSTGTHDRNALMGPVHDLSQRVSCTQNLVVSNKKVAVALKELCPSHGTILHDTGLVFKNLMQVLTKLQGGRKAQLVLIGHVMNFAEVDQILLVSELGRSVRGVSTRIKKQGVSVHLEKFEEVLSLHAAADREDSFEIGNNELVSPGFRWL